MGLPSKLKDLNVFNDGESYIGQIAGFNLPTLTRMFEDWRGGGMSGPVKIDMGQDALEAEWELGGLNVTVLRQYGITRVDGVQLRFAGAYQRQDTGAVDAVEVVIRGRHEEIDMGEAKPGEDTAWKVKTAIAYYKLTINGRVEIEIDQINGVERVGGVDRNADVRRAII